MCNEWQSRSRIKGEVVKCCHRFLFVWLVGFFLCKQGRIWLPLFCHRSATHPESQQICSFWSRDPFLSPNSYQWYITGEQSPLRSRDFSNRPWFQLWATSFSPLPPPTETVLCSELAKPWAHLFLFTQIRTHNANPCNQPVKFSSFLSPALYIQEYWEWQPS